MELIVRTHWLKEVAFSRHHFTTHPSGNVYVVVHTLYFKTTCWYVYNGINVSYYLFHYKYVDFYNVYLLNLFFIYNDKCHFGRMYMADKPPFLLDLILHKQYINITQNKLCRWMFRQVIRAISDICFYFTQPKHISIYNKVINKWMGSM